MAKAKIKITAKAVKKPVKKAPKKTSKRKKAPPRLKKWSDNHKAVAGLLEEELEGLITYLRSLHFTALVLILGSLGSLIYSLRVLFDSGQHAVIGFLLILITGFVVILTSIFVLKPWVLPRFLLPLDINDLNLNELLGLFKDPEEYLALLKNHIQILTDNFLLPKLKYLRTALALLIFGVSVAIILSIALP